MLAPLPRALYVAPVFHRRYCPDLAETSPFCVVGWVGGAALSAGGCASGCGHGIALDRGSSKVGRKPPLPIKRHPPLYFGRRPSPQSHPPPTLSRAGSVAVQLLERVLPRRRVQRQVVSSTRQGGPCAPSSGAPPSFARPAWQPSVVTQAAPRLGHRRACLPRAAMVVAGALLGSCGPASTWKE